jgi:hypothetical protein
LVTVLVISITTLVPSQRSTAVGRVKAKGAPHCTISSGAQVKTGGWVSTTVMVWLQNEALLHVSVALQVRVTAKIVGQRGLATFVTVLVISMTTLVPSQRSKAVGRVKEKGPLLHSTISSGAQTRFGGVVSTTVTV